ncbi:hypothetical protein BASA61_006593 [Batrachochytrium salamandrivorans]|nr:hypothetical protein BASA61_006593 [Batrachochytrium salamandrivorans]
MSSQFAVIRLAQLDVDILLSIHLISLHIYPLFFNMKFNALVVAAMVITSVNAGGRKGSPGCFGRRCGRSEPVVTQESTDESELKPVEPTEVSG